MDHQLLCITLPIFLHIVSRLILVAQPQVRDIVDTCLKKSLRAILLVKQSKVRYCGHLNAHLCPGGTGVDSNSGVDYYREAVVSEGDTEGERYCGCDWMVCKGY